MAGAAQAEAAAVARLAFKCAILFEKGCGPPKQLVEELGTCAEAFIAEVTSRSQQFSAFPLLQERLLQALAGVRTASAAIANADSKKRVNVAAANFECQVNRAVAVAGQDPTQLLELMFREMLELLRDARRELRPRPEEEVSSDDASSDDVSSDGGSSELNRPKEEDLEELRAIVQALLAVSSRSYETYEVLANAQRVLDSAITDCYRGNEELFLQGKRELHALLSQLH